MIQWPARVKVAMVSADLLTHMMTNGARVGAFRCVKGLPEGAHIVMATYVEKKNAVALYFQHDAWPLVAPGAVERLEIELDATTPVPA